MGRTLALRAGVVAVVALLALATPVSALAAGATGDVTETETDVDTTGVASDRPPTSGAAASQTRADPETDRQGWENGRWYDESLPSVDASDGYDQAELDAVVARSMARIEVIRDVEFEVTPPVRVISRETYRQNVQDRFRSADISANSSLHQNVKFEALFFVGENRDYFDVQQELQAASVGGFYVYGDASGIPNIEEGEIVLISDGDGPPVVNEITLAQELFHSLQDQQLGTIGDYDVATEEDSRAVQGVVEGDGNYVDYLYGQRCGAEWSCFQPESGGGGGGETPNIGLLVYGLVQYTEGPGWIAQVREEGGWEAVNELYDEPPASTEQYIHPEKYGVDEPTAVTLRDRSTAEWSIPELDGSPGTGPDYATFGEAGLYTMLWYPSYLSRSEVVIPPNDLFTGRQLDAYDYDHPLSAGWDGDKLYPYVNGSSATTNETGYVWRIEWDSEADAREFAGAYRQLLAYHDADQVGPDTYAVPAPELGGDFSDAFHVVRDGTTVTVVNAPSVEELSEVRTSVDVRAGENTTTTATTTTDPGAGDGTGTTTSAGPGTTTTTLDGPGQPGFGPVTAAAAVLVVALLALVRRR